MSVAILDARQWQRTVDLRTGHQVEAKGPLVDKVRTVVDAIPSPVTAIRPVILG